MSDYVPTEEYNDYFDDCREEGVTPLLYTKWLERELKSYVRWHGDAIDAFDRLRERVGMALNLPMTADLETVLKELEATQGDGK